MSTHLPLILYPAIAVGVVPLFWLCLLYWAGRDPDAAYWWLAVALAVSFVADVLSFVLPLRATNDSYPLLQSALIGLVLLDRPTAVLYAAVLGVTAMAVPLVSGLQRPDLLLTTVASLSVVWIAYRYRSLPRALRWSLLVGFGGFWLGWVWYVLDPGWGGWLAYQAARLVGCGLFCWAALKPGPSLTVAR